MFLAIQHSIQGNHYWASKIAYPFTPPGRFAYLGFKGYLSGFTTRSQRMKKLIHLRQVITNLIAAGWLNKYSVSAGLFVVWMLFFDKHNFFTQWSLQHSVHQLESSIEDYSIQLAEAEAAHKDLMINKEKFAREKYLMHRPDEDIFLFQ